MRAGNSHRILTINLSAAGTYLPVFMPELLPITQLFSPLVLSESLARMLAPYFQNHTVTLFHVLCRSLPCTCLLKVNPWREQGRGGLSGMLCHAMENSFVLVSFMSETGWWLTGLGNKLISCLSFFFLGLKSFLVHRSVSCEV